MIPELGHFALACALIVSLLQTTVPLVGVYTRNPRMIRFSVSATAAQLCLVAIAYAALTYAFISDDFSVRYVAMHSNTALPLPYKISAVWGAHEGSMLLWVLVLGLWSGAFCRFGKGIPLSFKARTLSVLGVLSTVFTAFILWTSNPFERLFPAAPDGRDLNPLLQDPGLVIHPPLLYLGYIGFSVVFALAIAALITGRLDACWARWMRPWTLLSWSCLTLGITLGSWWAYHELGWGGWWFWDPVENASFMPWLVGTALIHSLSVSGKRNTFKSWTVLLAIMTFSLSLLGTFLVRSGVLVSVHAFASDPARGVFILIFMAAIVGLSLLLFAWRAPMIRGRGLFTLMSRENFLLVNNVLLIVATAVILLAVLYPLLIDALDWGKISVGPPYFNAVFVPLTLPLVFLAGIGPVLQWKSATATPIIRRALPVLPVVMAVLIGLWVMRDGLSWGVTIGLAGGTWVLAATLYGYFQNTLSVDGRAMSFRRVPASFHGMSLAHIGLGIFAIGATFTSAYSVEREASLMTGEHVTLAGYRFTLESVSPATGPNYEASRARIAVHSESESIKVADLFPERRTYRVQTNPMTEAAINQTPLRDLYVALGESLHEDEHVLRVYYRPLVRWIWFGALLMALGGLIAACDRRYRLSS